MKVWKLVNAIRLSVVMMGIPEGVCSKCGIKRKGYALRIPRYQTCPKCGTGLEIMEDGKHIGSGFSPFTADQDITKPPDKILKKEAGKFKKEQD